MSRVVIVDDAPGYAAIAREVLQDGGFEVVGVAVDGSGALELAEALAPDVVLVDIGLPDIDGFEVARRLRARPRPPAVVLTSSRDWSDLGRRIRTCGAVGFVSKAELEAGALRALVGPEGRP